MKPSSVPWLLPAVLLLLSTRLEAAPAPAADGLDHPDCPKHLQLPARPSGSPVDDIRGLRPGASLDTAILYLECLDPQARYRQRTAFNSDILLPNRKRYYEGQVRTRVWLQAVPPYTSIGDEPVAKVDFQLVSFGEPGRETVFFIDQTQSFDQATQPTVRTVLNSLQKKYGTPSFIVNGDWQPFSASTLDSESHPQLLQLGWAWDGAGQPTAQRASSQDADFSCEGPGVSPCVLAIHATLNGDGIMVTSLTVSIRRVAAHAAAVRDADARWAAAEVEKAKDRKPAL